MNHPKDFYDRVAEIEAEAKGVMKQLQREHGGAWMEAWHSHPLAREYRALLRDAWSAPSLLEKAKRVRLD